MSWPSAAIFDFDGLLVDTAGCWQRAYVETLGRALEPEAHSALAGASVERAAAHLGVAADELRQRLFAAFREDRPALLRGARELVETLQPSCPLGVATNAPADLVEEALARVGLIDRFELV